MVDQKLVEDEIDLSDLEIGDVEVVVEADPIADELAEKAEPKAKKEKKAKAPKGEGLGSTRTLAEDEVGAGYIANLLGIDARELRGFLRKHYRNMETDKSTRYVWKKDAPQIQEIADAFKAAKAPKVKAEPKVAEKA